MVLERLEREPVETMVEHFEEGTDVPVELDREAFAEGIRLMMYGTGNSRWLPYVVHLAYQGDYTSIADWVAYGNRSLRESLPFGMLMSVTCSEDVSRIDPAEIPDLTQDTFLGDTRVVEQSAACKVWPRARMPAGFSDPVSSDVPVLLFSGRIDPVTPPDRGEDAASHLSNSLHVIHPGAHSDQGTCTSKIRRKFLQKASVRGLGTSCVSRIELPPFQVPQ